MTVRLMRWLFNLYPPFVGAGIHVTHIADDWRRLRVEMPLRWYSRNYVGTHFGGSLFVMADPFLMIMVMKNLGPGYLVWDRSAQIDFVAPGRGRVVVRSRGPAGRAARPSDLPAGHGPREDADPEGGPGLRPAREVAPGARAPGPAEREAAPRGLGLERAGRPVAAVVVAPRRGDRAHVDPR